MENNALESTVTIEKPEKHQRLNRFWWGVLVFYSALALLMAINQIFMLRIFGFEPVASGYYYYLMAFYLPWVFIIFPATRATRGRIPWYDFLLFFLSSVTVIYFGLNAMNILYGAWAMLPPPLPAVFSIILWGIVLEAVRRCAGRELFIFCTLFSLYPLFAGYMPGILRGVNYSFPKAAAYFAMGQEAIVGIPLRTIGDMIIGFLIFGVALTNTGGGKFFLNFALAALGRVRGGPAKVSVVASALFGTMSGSVISNVISTGSMTIPTMKRIGYPSYYAGAVESVASTGGGLMPPVMGAVAFIMASFLGVSYGLVITVAIVPAILWYVGLFAQVDAYAARHDLRGLSRQENLPGIWTTLKAGWFYIFALIALVYFLIYLRLEAYSAFYATALLIACAMIRKETRFTVKTFFDFIADTGKFMAQMVALLAGVGFIVGALAMTGVAPVLSTEMVIWAQGNILLLLFGGAAAAFILGMGMSVSAVYIFLAIVLAPALVKSGIEPLAGHLFILYWAMIANITPPVALASITAASIAGSKPMKTGFMAMRLALPLYFIPFFFVYNKAMLLLGNVSEVAITVLSALVGVIIIGYCLEGYLPKLGNLKPFVRGAGVAGGILLVTPEWRLTLAGLGIIATGVLVHFLSRRPAPKSLPVLVPPGR